MPTTARARTLERDVLNIYFSSVCCGVDSSPTPQHTGDATRRIEINRVVALLYSVE
jgi:hypothetical protein